MTKSPAWDIAHYLDDQGVGTFGGTSSWSLNASREPVDPPDAVTLYDTGGGEPDTDEQDLLSPTFQVRVRSLDFQRAYDKQIEIRNLLILPGKITTEFSVFVLIAMTSDVIDAGHDDNNRFILTANYRTIRERN